MEFLKTLLSGAVGAGLVAGIFMLFGKGLDHSHEDKKQKMTDTKELKNKVDSLTEQIRQTNERIDKLTENDRALLKAVNALLLHNMTGNATGKMAKAQEELTAYIIEKGE